MEKYELKADVRSTSEKLSLIRANKGVPGIVYGHHQEPISLIVSSSELLRTYRKAGASHIVVLEVGKKKINVLIHNLQRAPVTGEFTHVDFYAITSGEKVLTKIHLEFVGESEAKRLGGLIEEHIKEIEVKCLSENLVDSFEVDLSLLKEFGDMIKVSDLAIDSEKYDVITHEDDLVVIASKPLVYKEEEIAPAVSDDEEENSEDPK